MNLAILDKALAYIEEHPEQHEQAVWAEKVSLPDERIEEFEARTCGSSMCLAGHIAVLAGGQIDWPKAEWTVDSDGLEGRLESYGEYVFTPSGERMAIWTFAQQVLGIGLVTANALFSATNKLADLQAMRDALAADENLLLIAQ